MEWRGFPVGLPPFGNDRQDPAIVQQTFLIRLQKRSERPSVEKVIGLIRLSWPEYQERPACWLRRHPNRFLTADEQPRVRGVIHVVKYRLIPP